MQVIQVMTVYSLRPSLIKPYGFCGRKAPWKEKYLFLVVQQSVDRRFDCFFWERFRLEDVPLEEVTYLEGCLVVMVQVQVFFVFMWRVSSAY